MYYKLIAFPIKSEWIIIDNKSCRYISVLPCLFTGSTVHRRSHELGKIRPLLSWCPAISSLGIRAAMMPAACLFLCSTVLTLLQRESEKGMTTTGIKRDQVN